VDYVIGGRHESGFMAITIKSAEAERLARELAAATGESLTQAVTNALRERLQRGCLIDRKTRRRRQVALHTIRAAVAGAKVADVRCEDDIIGYNERGTFD
jgi:antitoxin VapB